MAAILIDNDPTPEAATLSNVLDSLLGSFYSTKAACENLQMQVWSNPRGLTPQQVFTALGTRAGAMVSVVTQTIAWLNFMRTHLKTADAAIVSLKPAGVILTTNADGTVTLT